jgi:hypothetical protein
MAYNCKITYVSWFILFHKRKDAMIRLNPVCGVALTATKSMNRHAIRKRIRALSPNLTRHANRLEVLDDSDFVGDYPNIKLAKSFLKDLFKAGKEFRILRVFNIHNDADIDILETYFLMSPLP